MKGLKMKKLLLMVSAIAAVFTSAAKADVTISGSAGLGVVNNGASSVQDFYTGGKIAFALSSTLDNGVAVSTSAGLTRDTNDAQASGSAGFTGFTAIKFAGGSSSITWGQDVDLAGEGAGGAGGAASDLVDEGGYDNDKSAGLTKDSGGGFIFSTAVGDMSISASYLVQVTPESGNVTRMGDTTDTTATGVSVSVPFGAASVSVGYASVEGDDNVSGAVLTYPVGDGSIAVGYRSVSDSTNESSWSVKYKTSLGSAAVAVSHAASKVGTGTGSTTEAQISQSLGGGASIFAELQSVTDTDADTDGSNFAIGNNQLQTGVRENKEEEPIG
jgi:hypothetical protein